MISITNIIPCMFAHSGGDKYSSNLDLDSRISIADLLIEHGASIDSINTMGASVLDLVMDVVVERTQDSLHVTRFVKNLIDNGLQINVTLERSSIQKHVYGVPSHSMFEMCRGDMAKRDSLLMKAIRARHEPIAKILIDSGADVNYVGTNGNDALSLCFDMKGEE